MRQRVALVDRDGVRHTITAVLHIPNGSFRKLGVPYFGVLIMGTIVGSPIFGNSSISS